MRASFAVNIRAGRPSGMPSVTLCRPFSLPLDLLPVRHHLLRPAHLDVAEHVRVAVDQLVVDTPGHPGQVELVLLPGQAGMEDDLEEQVPQLLLEVGVGRRRSPASSPAVGYAARASRTS